jgi:hypothetical protein
MKIRFIIYAALVSLVFGIFLYAQIQGNPRREWKSVSVGMNHQDVLKVLGPPKHSHKKEKKVEVWTNDGGFKQSSFYVYYYDVDHPDTVTDVCLSVGWVWQ